MRFLAGLVVAASLATLSASPAATAASPDPKALAEAISAIYVPLGLARAMVASCDRIDAPGVAAHAAALAAWREANDADGLERLVERVMAQYDAVAKARSKLDAALQSQADALVQKMPLACGALPTVFGGKSFALAANAGPARGVLEAFVGPAPMISAQFTN